MKKLKLLGLLGIGALAGSLIIPSTASAKLIIGDDTTFKIAGTANVNNLNMGKNDGIISVETESHLKSVLENAKINGEVDFDGGGPLDLTDDINITSDAGEVTFKTAQDINSTTGKTLKVDDNANVTLHNGGNNINAEVVNDGTITTKGGGTIRVLDNNGDAVNDGATITTLVSTPGSTMDLESGSIGATTGSTGGTISAKSGSTLGVATMHQNTKSVTVTNNVATLAETAAATAEIGTASGTATGTKGSETAKAVSAALNEALGRTDVSATITDNSGEKITKCKYAVFTNLHTEKNYSVIVKYDGKYYNYTDAATSSKAIAIYEACDQTTTTGSMDMLLNSGNDITAFSEENLAKLTEVYLVETENKMGAGTNTTNLNEGEDAPVASSIISTITFENEE